MKHLFCLAAIGLAVISASAAPELMDGVAAIVNERVITYSEVRQYVQPAIQQLRRDHSGDALKEKIHAAQLDALNNLIDRALIVHEYDDKGYKLPDNIIDTQIDEIIATDFGGNRTTFIKTLEAEKMTMSEYREKLRERIIVQAMRNRKMQQEVVVSPYQIEKYYQEHLDDFKEEDKIKLRMIYIKKSAPPVAQAAPVDTNLVDRADEVVDESEAQRALAKTLSDKAFDSPELSATDTVGDAAGRAETSIGELPDDIVSPAAPAAPAASQPAPVAWTDPQRVVAETVLAKLKAGESFESVAQEFSEAREKSKGGDWGWIERDILMKQLSDVAFALKKGEHSDLIETEDAYYILFVEDAKPAHTRPLGEARAEIEKQLLQEQRTKAQEQWVKELREKAYIRVF